jgi:hypothetical protein
MNLSIFLPHGVIDSGENGRVAGAGGHAGGLRGAALGGMLRRARIAVARGVGAGFNGPTGAQRIAGRRRYKPGGFGRRGSVFWRGRSLYRR